MCYNSLDNSSDNNGITTQYTSGITPNIPSLLPYSVRDSVHSKLHWRSTTFGYWQLGLSLGLGCRQGQRVGLAVVSHTFHCSTHCIGIAHLGRHLNESGCTALTCHLVYSRGMYCSTVVARLLTRPVFATSFSRPRSLLLLLVLWERTGLVFDLD